jgi:hypothetical protein
MASNSHSLGLTTDSPGQETRAAFLQRLTSARRKIFALRASAVASVVMLAFAGLTDLPLPVLIGLLIFAADMQYLALRVRLEAPAVLDEEHEEAVNALQTQVEHTRNEGPSGLHQRWYMEWRLRQECARCRRYGLSLAVIVVKVEGPPGVPTEEWLPEATRAAEMTASAVRNVDLAADVGIGEFALSLVHCDHVGAIAAMGRLAYELKGFQLQMGSVVFPEDDVSAGEIIDLAYSRLEPWGDPDVDFEDEDPDGEADVEAA